MAGAGTKRIVDLTETSEVQSGDYLAIDSTARGTKKTPASVFAKAADLTAEQIARQQADEAEAQARTEAINAEKTAREEADDALTESVTALSDEVTAQGALIQNPTKTVSGSIAHFTDGADMPAESVIVNIEPVQSGTGTPSPDNIRQISGWESVDLWSGTANALDLSWWSGKTSNGITFTLQPNGKVRMHGTVTQASWTFIDHEVSLPYNGIGAGDEILLYSDSQIFIRFYNGSTLVGDVVSGANPAVTTIPTSATKMRIFIYAFGEVPTAGATVDAERSFYLSRNTTFTEWQPYTGTTTTTSLGRTVYGGTLDVVSGVLTAYPYYPSYNGETLNGRWVCDRAVYSEGVTPPTGSQVALISGTGTTYQLTPTEVSTLLGENNVWADAGAVSITYRRDINLALEQLEALLNS